LALKAPFPYFGGKRKVAGEIWQRFGMIDNYVEPFFGSGAVLLARPEPFDGLETVNDADGLLSNFWRALRADPDAVAHHADWPVNENDLHARHAWLVGQKSTLQAKLEGDPDFYDTKAAGWWCWGMACWIGSGFCSGNGPWQVQEVDGVRQLVHLGNNGQGVNRQLVHLGDNGRGEGVEKKRPVLPGPAGGKASLGSRGDIQEYFQELSGRLRNVRVCCGDWSRVCGPSVTFKHGMTGVFLDPPYADTANRQSNLYRVDCESVAHKAREWAISNGDNPLLRIALAGYEGEHQMPESWQVWSLERRSRLWRSSDQSNRERKTRTYLVLSNLFSGSRNTRDMTAISALTKRNSVKEKAPRNSDLC
jgi:site-specific DNA-adenine methylase